MESCHPTNDDLERYLLGITKDDIRPLEEHLICCPDCVDRAEVLQSFIDIFRDCTSVTSPDSRLAVQLLEWTFAPPDTARVM